MNLSQRRVSFQKQHRLFLSQVYIYQLKYWLSFFHMARRQNPHCEVKFTSSFFISFTLSNFKGLASGQHSRERERERQANSECQKEKSRTNLGAPLQSHCTAAHIQTGTQTANPHRGSWLDWALPPNLFRRKRRSSVYCFPNYSSEFTRSGRDVDGELRCRCGFGEPVVNSCIGEQQKVKRTRFLFSSPRLFSYGGGSIYTLNTNSLCSSPRVRSRLLSMLMRQTTRSASAVWTWINCSDQTEYWFDGLHSLLLPPGVWHGDIAGCRLCSTPVKLSYH